jgi:hypothetical protein
VGACVRYACTVTTFRHACTLVRMVAPIVLPQIIRDGTSRIVTGSADNDIRVWRQPGKGHAWACEAVLKGHTKGITSLALDRTTG